MELDDLRPNFSQELNEGFSRLKAMIKRYLDQGKGSGDLRADVDTVAVTEMIFAGMLGASIIHGTEKTPRSIDRCFNALIAYLDSLKP